jgi:sacsin
VAAPVPGGGRLFHSLPLPIKTGLPVHINAALNVSSNRRSMCDEDDDKGAWNRALFGNLVRGCYLELLERAAEALKHASVHLLLPVAAVDPWTHHVQV